MNKSVILTLVVFLSLAFVSADACDLSVSLLNQDPYPAVPGDYVKLVFQIEGLESPLCNDITFNLHEDYPIEFDPGQDGQKRFSKIDYVKDYNSNLLIPYEVRIDEDALDGANPIEVNFQSKGDAPLSKTFDIEVENVKADFEVYVKNYDYTTNEITLEILNIESSDIEALSVSIPKQDSIEVKGASKSIVGDLDSNEYTTAEFEAIPKEGTFKIELTYSDAINVRRTVEKEITFDSSYFTNRKADQKSVGAGTYIFWAVVLIVVIWFVVKKVKKKKKK